MKGTKGKPVTKPVNVCCLLECTKSSQKVSDVSERSIQCCNSRGMEDSIGS